jgi:DNA-binding response OmpR family regulator
VKLKLLLVEDEVNLARGLVLNFQLEGYEVQWASTGAAARQAWSEGLPDLVVLDLMLPDASGFDLLQELKRLDIRVPVLVLTARASDEDRIMGLSLGADDYLTKPFNLKELVLRVKGMARRGVWYREPSNAAIQIADASVLPSKSAICRDGQEHTLTEREMALLLHLWRKRGTFVSREELLVEVWGYSPETQTRTVDIFISRLRRLLGDDAGSPKILLTRRGQGYMLANDYTTRG